MPTPPLPYWIRDASVEGYVTAHALVPGETRLYGTESLFGDWDAPVLLLAKDFAPSRLLHERLAEGDPRPYRHVPDLRTNVRLRMLVGALCRSDDPERCGLLYGSALANLLRDDGRWSGALPNRREALAYAERAFAFTLAHMSRLEAVVCMGREAARAAAAVPASGGVRRFEVPHPAARVSNEHHREAWEPVIAALAPSA